MTCSNQGFLSPAIDTWTVQTVSEFPKTFSFVDGLNRDAMRVLQSLNPDRKRGYEIVAAALCARAIQSFQGAVLLARRGMPADARTLLRGVIENAIFIAAITERPNFIEKMVHANNRYFLRMGEAVLKQLKTEEVADQADAVELEGLLNTIQDGDFQVGSINLEQLASDVGLSKLYSLFREFSGDSAHPTLFAVERHVQRDTQGEIKQLIFHPQKDGMEKVLLDAFVILSGVLEAVGRVFIRQDVQQLVDSYCSRIREMKHA